MRLRRAALASAVSAAIAACGSFGSSADDDEAKDASPPEDGGGGEPSRSPDDARGSDASFPDGPTTSRRVFVTSSTVTIADDAGVAPLDAYCQSVGSVTFGPTTQWTAWLSLAAPKKKASDRFTWNGAWTLGDGTRVAASRAALDDGGLENPIDRDEHDVQVTNTFVFTGTLRTGEPGQNCIDWRTSASSVGAVLGNASLSSSEWTESQVRVCSDPAHLYCFEQ
jgi:hypothetical protein